MLILTINNKIVHDSQLAGLQKQHKVHHTQGYKTSYIHKNTAKSAAT